MKFSSIVKSGASALLAAAFCLPLQTNAAAPTELESYVVGSLAGQFSVDQGAANYSVPIAVPPGVAGVQPELAFSYSSGGNDGPMGLGWSVSGFSGISRCGRTVAVDGSLGGIEWQQLDRYCIDGQRLVLVAGDYGADGSEYNTESDGFARIRAHGQAGQGPEWFSVQTKSGQVMEYGRTEDSRVEAVGRVEAAVWAQNKLQDAVGNQINFVYAEDPATGEHSVDRIEYADNTVQFIYESASRTRKYYSAGSSSALTKRLVEVSVSSAGNLVSHYSLLYQITGNTQSQVLTSIQQCLPNGSCLSPTKFAWIDEGTSAFSPYSTLGAFGFKAGNWVVENHPRLTADVNGDGRSDVVGFANNGVEVSLATDTGFTAPTEWASGYGFKNGWKTDRHPRTMADVNGDGLADVVGFGDSGVFVSLSTGSSFTERARWNDSYGYNAGGWRTDQHPRMMADVNGDGLADVVGFADSGVFVSLSTGSSFAERIRWIDAYGYSAGGWRTEQHPRTMADVNGDGRADVVGFAGGGVFVSLSTGNGFTVPSKWVAAFGYDSNAGGWRVEHHPRTLADVNGDGLPDVVGFSDMGVDVSLSTGAGFTAPARWVDGFAHNNGGWSVENHPRMLAELNGDGLADVVGFADSGVFVSLSTGSSFTERQKWSDRFGYAANAGGWLPDNHPRTIADVNGDGLGDILGFSNAGVEVDASQRNSIKLVSIESGLGDVIGVSYESIAESSSPYQRGSGSTYPVIDLQGPLYVVSAVEKSNGVGGNIRTHYGYGGLRVSLDGRGALGYAWDEATDESTGVTTRTEYHQDYPFTGMPKAVTTYAADGTVLSSTTTTYEDLYAVHPETRPDGSVWDYETHFPYLVEKVEESYELDGTLVSTATTRQSNYDAYGNVGTVEVVTEAGGETFSKVTTSNYDNVITADKWHLGRLRDATVVHTHSNGSTETRKSAFTYYAETGLLKDEIIEPDQPAYRQVTTYEYDAFGNKVRVAVSADGLPTRISTSGYDPSGRFATSVQNALGHAEARTFDHATGKALSLTGPNNLTTRWEYDGLARVERELRADGTETLTTRTWVDASDAHAPVAAYYKVTEEISGSAPASVYYDQLGRVIRKLSTGFDGKAIYQDTEYDAQGREYRSSLPYFVDDPAYWVVNHYDEVNRVVKKSFDTGKGTVVTQIDYQGLTTVETNTLGQVKRTTKNALGKVVLVEEEEGGKVTYEYDAIGNLLKTHQHDDANAKVVTTELWYDVRGQKTAMQDPDMGYWSYQHNAFGELVSQTDAKNQSVSMTYDKLGRMTRRVEPEGETVWTYDTAQKGIGKLHKVEQFDAAGTLQYRTEHSYDNFGREIASVNAFDGKVFNTAVEYDAFGRVAKSWRPNGFETENLYNQYGYLLAKRSPSNDVNDYDAQHLAGLYDDAVTSAQSALDAAADLLDRQAYFLEYEALGDTTVNLPQDLLDQLQEAAELSHYAAQALSADIDNALTLAEQLIVVAGGLRDRMEQAELWVDASQSETLDAMLADPAYVTWWRATSRDAAGRLTGQRTGNGLVTIQDYDRATGQLNTIQTGFGHGDLIRHLDYEYDALDNVLARRDRIQDAHETFDYDGLNRLVASTVDGTADGIAYRAETTYVYDALGNMLNKSDVGTYLYGNAAKSVGNAGPHALSHAANDEYIYDDNGSITEGGGRTITWTSFNKPTSFQKDGTVVQFHYGPDRARYKKTVGGMVGFDETTLYLGKSYERVEKSNGEVTHKYFVYADDGLAAIHVEHEDGNGVIDESRDETRYLHRDALGSIDTITDGQGVIVERTGYSPFGERRAGDWRTIGGLNLALYTNRGFTGHEHIDEVGLIHMNGRVYDPQLGRFLSADPHVQAPFSSQSYNRYAYAMNNPLKYTDPSGYFFKKLFKSIKKAFKSIGKFFKKYGKAIVAIAAAAFVGPAVGAWATGAFSSAFAGAVIGGAAAGFTSSLIMTGSFSAGIEGALFGGLAGGLAWGIGHGGVIGSITGPVADASLSSIGRAIASLQSLKHMAHGVAQGIVSKLRGNSFRSGYYAGFFGSAIPADGFDTVAGRTVAAAVIGGVAAELGGGKFANGARTIAFLHLFKVAPGFYKRTVGYGLDAGPGGASVEKGLQGMPVQGANNIGTQGRWVYDSNGQRVIGFFEEGGPVSNFANQIPGINAVAGMHDVQQVAMGNSIWRDVLNVPGMAVAAGVTYAGFAGQALNAAPDYLYVPIQINDDDRKPRYMWVPAGGY